MKIKTRIIKDAIIDVENGVMTFFFINSGKKKQFAKLYYRYKQLSIQDEVMAYRTYYKIAVGTKEIMITKDFNEALDYFRNAGFIIPKEAIDIFKSNCSLMELAAV